MRGSSQNANASKFSVLLTNIRSLMPKRDNFSALINDTDCDIIALTETWLSSKVKNSELFYSDKQYVVFCKDRAERCGGGVLLAINQCIECSFLPVVSDLESVWSCLNVNFKKIVVGVCYRSPSSPASFCDQLHDCLNQVTVRYPGASIILLGDFNFPSIDWLHVSSLTCSSPTESSHFVTLCSDFGLSQVVTSPTRVTQQSSSILDLVLTSSPDTMSRIFHLPGLSDHDVLHFELTVPKTSLRKRFKKIRDYSKGNYEAINNELSLFIETFLPHYLERTVEDNWLLFKNKLLDLVNKIIPLRRVFF